MKVKKAQKLRNTLLIVGTIIMLLGHLYGPFAIIGAIVALSCLISHFLWNKCPIAENSWAGMRVRFVSAVERTSIDSFPLEWQG